MTPGGRDARTSRSGLASARTHGPEVEVRSNVPSNPFPGYPPYLAAAAGEIGRPEAEAPARRNVALSAMANLLAQASLAEPAHVPVILEKAAEFRDQLHA